MPTASSNLFHRLAHDVLVRDVQREFAFIWDVEKEGSDEAKLVRQYLKEPGIISDAPVLLTANYRIETTMTEGEGFPVGVWFPRDVFRQTIIDGAFNEELLAKLNDPGSLDDGCAVGTIELPPGSIISASTPLLELFDARHGRCFPRLVCDGFGVTGVVTSQDLLGAPARICLLAMALELEEQAAALCRTFAPQCFASLSPGRQHAAMTTFMRKYGAGKADKNLTKLSRKIQDRSLLSGNGQLEGSMASLTTIAPILIDCTTFTDKATMLQKCKLLLDASNRDIQKVFKRVEVLRNLCAHSGGDSIDWDRPISDLRELVPKVHQIMATIAETQEREWKVRMKPISSPEAEDKS